mgnify:FL=1
MNIINRFVCNCRMNKPIHVGIKKPVYHPRIKNFYNETFNSDYPFHLNIVAAPKGSGKTSLLKMYCNEYIKQGGKALYLSHPIGDYDNFISNFIRGPFLPGRCLAEYLPKKSVIVLDHIDGHYDDVNTLNSNEIANLRILLLILMHEIPLYGNFNVVAVASNPNLVREMLKLNNYCKIELFFDPILHKWESHHLQPIVDSIFHDKDPLQKKEITRLASIAGTPGFLNQIEISEEKALQIQDEWNDFSYENLFDYTNK